jgi:hypothetical protein
MPNKLVDLVVEEVSLVAAPANADDSGPRAKVTLFKSAGAKPVKKDSACRNCGSGADEADQFCRGCGVRFYKSEEEEMPEDKVEKKTEPEVTPEPTEIEKALRAEIEKEQAAREDLAKRLADEKAERETLEKKVAEGARILKVRDVKDRVEKTLKSVPASVEDVTEALVKLEEFDPELAKFVEGTLAKCAEVIGESELLKTKSEPAGEAKGSAIQKAEAKIAEKMKADPKLSRAKAEATVWQENEDLYKEYLSESAAS